jgi:AcrR family transcriptional regulator
MPTRRPATRDSRPETGNGNGILRRTPRQDRGQRRVERILDAAETLIAERGVETVTTNAIAERAEISIGSVYQFFPNKDAIVHGLAARFAAEHRALNEAVLPLELAHLPLPELIDRVIGPLARFYANPAYRHVYHATNRPGEPSELEAGLHRTMVRRVESVIAARAPRIAAPNRRLYAAVAVELVHALLAYAATAARPLRGRIPGELRAVLLSYFARLEEREGVGGANGRRGRARKR